MNAIEQAKQEIQSALESIHKVESDLGWSEDSQAALASLVRATAALSSVDAQPVGYVNSSTIAVLKDVGEGGILMTAHQDEDQDMALYASPLPQAAQPVSPAPSDKEAWEIYSRAQQSAGEKKGFALAIAITQAIIAEVRALAAHPVAPGVPEGFRLEKLYEPERIKVEKIGGGFCCFCKTGSGGVETAAFEFLNAMLSASPSLATERDAVDAQKVRDQELIIRKFYDLPLGTPFRYIGKESVYVILGHHGCGLVAAYHPHDGWVADQSIFSFADTEDECKSLEVEVVALQSQPASAGKDAEDARRWISITDRLPEPNQVVCLVDENRWRNTGGDFDVNVHACGYLASVGHQMYWSCFSEPRGLTLDAFTHWTPVPAISAIAQQESGK